MKENNNYTKKNSFREPKQVIEKVQKEQGSPLEHLVKSISSHYSKTEVTISAKLYIIISGGSETEKTYFNFLKHDRFNRIKIEFISKKNQGLTTIKLYDVAKEIKDKIKDSLDEDESDLFFLLSDRDHYYPDLLKISPWCKSEGFHLIVCNPCFELWLYYGYFSISPEKNGFAFSNIKKVSHEFTTFLGSKTKEIKKKTNRPIYEIETAISNSKANYSEDENGIPVQYATNMFVLGKELLPLIKQELGTIQREKEVKEAKYRSENV